MSKSKTFIIPYYEERPIKVTIANEAIIFTFPTQEDREFYDINLSDFIKDRDYWLLHMQRKNWFTYEMEEYLIKSIPSK